MTIWGVQFWGINLLFKSLGYTRDLDFDKARHDGVAVVSAGPSANHLHLARDR